MGLQGCVSQCGVSDGRHLVSKLHRSRPMFRRTSLALSLATLFAGACLSDPPPDRISDDDVAPVDPDATELADSGSAFLRTTHGVMPVAYQRYRDLLVIQGDILISPDEFLRSRIPAADVDAEAARPAEARGAVRVYGSAHWPGAIIPFRIDSSIFPGDAATTDIAAAIAHWQSKTHFIFRAKTASDVDFVTFRRGTDPDACFSFLGRKGGEQFIDLSLRCRFGEIVHEIGHAVGLLHEQQRLDRDSYVTINYANVKPAYKYAFDKYITAGAQVDGTDAGVYDYASIMHYGANDFSINSLPTIVPKQSGVTIGQRAGLSVGDIQAVSSLYSDGGVVSPEGTIVTLARNPSYGGVFQHFVPGFYSGDEIGIVGDNQASSLIVSPGFAVELWTDVANAGANQRAWFYDSTPQLPAPFDNNVSGLDIQRVATAYRDQNLGGIKQAFLPGEYRAAFGQLNIVGSGISSLYMPPGLMVELCADDAAVVCRTFVGQVNYVGDSVNDRVRIVRVKPAVTLYETSPLSGPRTTVGVGTYISFGPIVGLSQLTIHPKLKATACTVNNNGVGGGTCVVLRGDVSYLGPAVADNVHWLKVENNTAI